MLARTLASRAQVLRAKPPRAATVRRSVDADPDRNALRVQHLALVVDDAQAAALGDAARVEPDALDLVDVVRLDRRDVDPRHTSRHVRPGVFHTPVMTACLVVVGGAPASGKTTLAHRIAVELGAALLAKDDVKEALADTLGAGDRARSRELGSATYEVLYVLARRALESGARVVLESNFYRERSTDRLREIAAGVPTVVLVCRASEAIRRSRYASRTDRHPVHLDAEILASDWPSDDAYDIDLGVPRLLVDTTDGYRPGLDEILAFVRRLS